MTRVGADQADADRRDPTQRIIGFLVLLVAAFAVLVVPKVLSPGWAGLPSAVGFADPPPVGACLDLERAGEQITVVKQVPCRQAHDGEVAKSWRPDETPVPTFVLNRNYSMLATDADGNLLPSDPLCSGWGSQYVGTIDKFGPALWAPVDPSYFTGRVIAPPGEGTTSRHWVACVVQPGTQSPYIGTVRDSGGDGGAERPSAFGWCFPADQTSPSLYSSCAQQHRVEQLATFIPTQQMFYANTITVDTTQSEIDQTCVALVTKMIGASDPTFDGRLEILSMPVGQALPVPSEGALYSSQLSGLVIPDCLIRYSGPGQLTGTVVGLGDSPLPVG